MFRGQSPVVGLLLLSAAALLDFYIMWLIMSKIRRIARWTKTSGQVIRQLEVADDECTRYTPVIGFADQWGRFYECQPNFSLRTTNRYPVGSQIKVAYNPENPEQADVDPTWVRYFSHGVCLFMVTIFPMLFGYFMAFGPFMLDIEVYTAMMATCKKIFGPY